MKSSWRSFNRKPRDRFGEIAGMGGTSRYGLAGVGIGAGSSARKKRHRPVRRHVRDSAKWPMSDCRAPYRPKPSACR